MVYSLVSHTGPYGHVDEEAFSYALHPGAPKRALMVSSEKTPMMHQGQIPESFEVSTNYDGPGITYTLNVFNVQCLYYVPIVTKHRWKEPTKRAEKFTFVKKYWFSSL